jgi:hypothetical protein
MSVVMAVQNLRADGDVSEEGGVKKMNVTNTTQDQLLTDILKELKKLNFHMSLMTDTTITNQEVA